MISRFNVVGRRQEPAARRHRPDYWLLILTAVLLAIGLVVIYSISPALSQTSHVGENYYFNKQLIAIILGFVAFGFATTIPYKIWPKYAKLLLIAAALATAIALVLPVNPLYPAHRWIRFGFLSFQSVELVTFAVLIWLAKLLADRRAEGNISGWKAFKPIVAAVLIMGLIIAGVQSDLGSMGVIIIMMGAMIYVAGLPMKKFLVYGGIVVTIALLAISITPYRRERLAAYLHPTADCQGSGYQACQALISVGSGGMIGLGLGRSVQAYGYQPESANDSIFAIFGEKFGFIGSVILLGIFGAFFVRCKRIIERAPDDFARLVGVGILAWLGIQTIINIGAMIGVLPLKGITLPFISYGGTSVVFTMAAVGILFEISRYTTFSAPEANKSERSGSRDNSIGRRRQQRGAYNAQFSGRP